MRRFYLSNNFSLIIVVFLTFTGCIQMSGSSVYAKTGSQERDNSKRYYLGRFSFEIPEDIKSKSISNSIYYTNVEDFVWSDSSKNEYQIVWDKRLSAIKNLPPPNGVDNIIISEKDLSTEQYKARGIFYHGNSSSKLYGSWDVLYDNGRNGLWLQIDGTVDRRDFMVDIIKTLMNSYSGNSSNRTGFHIENGFFKLQLKDEEKVSARFEGHPLDKFLKLEIDINTVEEVDKTSIIERLDTVISTNYAQGLKIEKIKSEKRTISGYVGEELIYRGIDGDDRNVSFAWRYSGKVDSEVFPEIYISMDTEDKDFDKKLLMWDSILKSMKLLPQ